MGNNFILEYKTIMGKMEALGIRVREDKIDDYKKMRDLMTIAYDKFLIDYSD